jgi:hypothetical protein
MVHDAEGWRRIRLIEQDGASADEADAVWNRDVDAMTLLGARRADAKKLAVQS